MIASKIRENLDYAVSTTPRKGIPDDRLHRLPAQHVRVKTKGVQRFADTAKDEYGDFGVWKMDGIYAVRIALNGEEGGIGVVYKARDFLMPWSEYESRREAEAEKNRIKAEEEKKRADALQSEFDAALDKLSGVEGLIFSDSLDGRDRYDSEKFHIEVDDIDRSFRVTPKGADYLLGYISNLAYKLLREADEG